MVSRFKRLIPILLGAFSGFIAVAWMISGCSAEPGDVAEVQVTAVQPAPGSLSDATLPPFSSPPFNCFSSRLSPTTSVWICEIPQPTKPGDPAPKNVGDPLR